MLKRKATRNKQKRSGKDSTVESKGSNTFCEQSHTRASYTTKLETWLAIMPFLTRHIRFKLN